MLKRRISFYPSRNKSTILAILFGVLMISSMSVYGQGLIIDHNCTDIDSIPAIWINQAKADLHIAYGHTSHGSQLITGMDSLDAFMGGTGLYVWNDGPLAGYLDIDDYFMPGDLGHDGDTTWATYTRTYLDDPANSDVNVVIWSWCGGCSDNTEEGINIYLNKMNQLEGDYPDVDFVYMTGHLDIWSWANLKARNQQIRDYCIANDKILYDFADIESYDPDNTYFEYANDNCDYYSDATGSNLLGNWAIEWQDSHIEGVDWYNCPSAHSEPLNANQKAYTAWWLWARLAGWGGAPPSGYSVHPTSLSFGQVYVGSSKADTITITNNDTVAIVIDSLSSDNSVFTLVDLGSDITGFTLPVGGSREIRVTFTPTDVQIYSGTLTIYSSDAGNKTVSLSGEGIEEPVPPSYEVYPTSLSFGSVLVDSSAMDTVTITNIDTEPVVIDSIISDNSAFTLTDLGSDIAGFTLAVGESREIQVTFTPTSATTYTGTLTIYSSSSGNETVSITGVGTTGECYHVSGDVSGIWNYSNICVDGDITVPDGHTLQIIPAPGGTNIKFTGHYRFSVVGRLLAEGTQSDSIFFFAENPTTGWHSLRFYNLTWNGMDSSRVSHCSIMNGKATGTGYDTYGGGIFITYSSTLHIEHCRIVNNSAEDGGGIYIEGSDPVLRNLRISNNSATNGGGVHCDYASPTMSYCTITGNSAVNGGGVFYYGEDSGSPELINCTMYGNIASSNGGAILCADWSNPVLKNCILWSDSPEEIYIVDGSVTATYSDIGGSWSGTGNINADPLFVDAGSGDFHLTSSSPCIDAGDPTSPLDPDSTTADMGAFYFNQFIPDAPENIVISEQDGSVHISWDTVENATSYTVYSSDSPYSGFTEDETGTYDGTSWTAPISEDKKFYYVKAVSE